MQDPPPIITEPHEATATWLEHVFAHTGRAASVTTVESTPVGTGLMGRSYRLRLRGEGDLPASVVVKLTSADLATRQLGSSGYRKEIGFYRDVAPAVDATVPVCHWADISDDGERFVLVLEDIHDAVQGDQIRGCSPDDAERAIRNLARLHASTWGRQELAELPWIQPTTRIRLSDFLPMALDAFGERFRSELAPVTWPVLEAFVERAEAWQERQPPTRAAVHGDYRLDNLLFGAPGGAVTAVDWQTVDYVCPGRDVGYFLGNSLTIEDRRNAEAALLAAYHDELRRGGVADYDRDAVLADMGHGAFQGPLVTMLGAFVASRTDRSEGMFVAMADRSAAQILDHDALDLLG